MGNVLLSDDGIGIHAVRLLQQQRLPGVTVAEIGTAVLHGLSLVEAASRVLIIDAARGGRPPGTIYQFEAAEGSKHHQSAPCSGSRMHSLHSMSLLEVFQVLGPRRPLPPVTIIGVEPASLDYGLTLSPVVAAALARVVELALQTVLRWRAEPSSDGHKRTGALNPTCPHFSSRS